MVLPLLDSTVMKLLIAAAFASVTSGTALAQPGTIEPQPITTVQTEPRLSPPMLTEPLPPPSVPTMAEWYGWQVLIADGATLGLAVATQHGDLALGWIGTGAVVHVAHGNYGRAVASVGLRVALPLLGVWAGAASAQGCTGDLCGLGEALVGGLVGMGAAEVIDLVIARDEHEIAPAKLSQRWTPVASVRHSGATFGIAARF